MPRLEGPSGLLKDPKAIAKQLDPAAAPHSRPRFQILLEGESVPHLIRVADGRPRDRPNAASRSKAKRLDAPLIVALQSAQQGYPRAGLPIASRVTDTWTPPAGAPGLRLVGQQSVQNLRFGPPDRANRPASGQSRRSGESLPKQC
jgi:hypothetical protein